MAKINIRAKGQEGEREVARAMNSIVETVLTKHGITLPDKPIVQRNQNQSAVGGSDLTNPFHLAVEVKRQEQLSVNTWWKQCCTAAIADGAVPVLVYRRNKQAWSVVMLVDVALGDGSHVSGVRAEIAWDAFLQWFYNLVDRRVARGEWFPADS